MEIEKTDSHIPSASATAKLIPNQNTKGAFPSTITPHPSVSSFDWKRLLANRQEIAFTFRQSRALRQIAAREGRACRRKAHNSAPARSFLGTRSVLIQANFRNLPLALWFAFGSFLVMEEGTP